MEEQTHKWDDDTIEEFDTFTFIVDSIEQCTGIWHTVCVNHSIEQCTGIWYTVCVNHYITHSMLVEERERSIVVDCIIALFQDQRTIDEHWHVRLIIVAVMMGEPMPNALLDYVRRQEIGDGENSENHETFEEKDGQNRRLDHLHTERQLWTGQIQFVSELAMKTMFHQFSAEGVNCSGGVQWKAETKQHVLDQDTTSH